MASGILTSESSLRKRVLFVGGRADDRGLVEVLLHQSDIDVLFVDTFRETLFWAGTEAFHALVWDRSFSRDEGSRLCRAVRDKDPSRPIIFFNSFQHNSEIERSEGTGVIAYIKKTYLADLAKAIAEAINSPSTVPTA